MATENHGFVDVTGQLEPAAIASAIARDAHARVAEVVTLTCDHLEEDGRPLNQLQKLMLAANASRGFDGFEADTLEIVLEAMRRA